MKKPLKNLRTRMLLAGGLTAVAVACSSNAPPSDGTPGAGSGSSGGGQSSGSSGSEGGVAADGSSSGAGSSSSSGAGGSTGGSSGASSGPDASGSSSASSGPDASGRPGTGGQGPCDVYAAGGTPCVAAYSMVRSLYSKYSGPLYQVRKGGTRNTFSGDSPVGTVGGYTGGTFQDIAMVAGGYADGASQDTFCGTSTCTISKLYDQSGNGNDLTQGSAGASAGTAHQPDYEADATKLPLTANGHKVYALYTIAHDGYRNDKTTGIPTGNMPQGIYMIANGKRGGPTCCFDFGNAGKNNADDGAGSMAAIFFGTGSGDIGKGAGTGPWVLGDFEAGVWAGGAGASNAVNMMNPSASMEYAFGIVNTSSAGYAIKVGDATMGALTTAYNGASPQPWGLQGAVLLGIGGDNSNSSYGDFYEGAITAGRPGDATDTAVFQNVQAAGYGK